MSKYWTIFLISWQNEFIYRLNFLLWRFRNVIRFLMTYFLWSGVFLVNRQVFGYSASEMLTYIFLLLIVASLVFSSPSSDNIGGEISNGDISNYLIKPISYLKYWFTRDLSSKMLNLLFATFEISILWLIFRPQIVFPDNFATLTSFFTACLIAVLLFFQVSCAIRFTAFWAPENTWPIAFLSIVIMDLLSGAIFPLDILPDWLYNLLQVTPFPYLLYFPVAIFIGKITGIVVVKVLVQALLWVLVMRWVVRIIWQKGLVAYTSEGR